MDDDIHANHHVVMMDALNPAKGGPNITALQTLADGGDITCEQIQRDETKWNGVADKIKSDWTRCLREIQLFENLLEEDERKRMRYARYLKIFGFLMMMFQNLFSGVSATIPLIKYKFPYYITNIFTIITFIMSLALWSRLGETSYKFLIVAEDSKRLKLMCKSIRKTLCDVIQDGKITEKERMIIRDMIGQMHRRSEEIGSMNLMMKILGNESTQNGSQIKMFSNKSYQAAYNGVGEIIDEIGKTQLEIKAKAPQILKEYQNNELQLQIHSSNGT